jgi:hypothetical protein
VVGCGARVVGCGTELVRYDAELFSCDAEMVHAATDDLPTSADELPNSPRFGDGVRSRVDEEVSAGDEDPDIDGDAPFAPPSPATQAYSMVKSRSAVADPSSTALSYAQPCPSSNTMSCATRLALAPSA